MRPQYGTLYTWDEFVIFLVLLQDLRLIAPTGDWDTMGNLYDLYQRMEPW